MNITIGKYTLSITLSDNSPSWERKVILEVEKMVKLSPSFYGGAFLKIPRIKAVRQLAAMFPEDIRGYGGSYALDKKAPLLSPLFSKNWVESHWQDNGYGDPIL